VDWALSRRPILDACEVGISLGNQALTRCAFVGTNSEIAANFSIARHPPGTKPISLLAQQDRRINRERALRRNPRRYQPEQAHSQHSAS